MLSPNSVITHYHHTLSPNSINIGAGRVPAIYRCYSPSNSKAQAHSRRDVVKHIPRYRAMHSLQPCRRRSRAPFGPRVRLCFYISNFFPNAGLVYRMLYIFKKTHEIIVCDLAFTPCLIKKRRKNSSCTIHLFLYFQALNLIPHLLTVLRFENAFGSRQIKFMMAV